MTARRVLTALLLLFLHGCTGDPTPQHLQAARQAIAEGSPETARSLYLEVLQRHPHTVEAIEGMVNLTRDEPDSDEHKHWCRTLLMFRPWDRHANLIIGLTRAQERTYNDAMNRLILAYMDSEFTLEKKQALEAIQKVRALHRHHSMENQP